MSNNFIPLLVDERKLADEIQTLKNANDYDTWNWTERLSDALKAGEHASFAKWKVDPKTCFSSADRSAFDADNVRFQLLKAAQPRDYTISDEQTRSADALYQFFQAFFCCWSYSLPFNEYGLTNSTIVGQANAKRLHAVFTRIDFDSLRPLYEKNCTQNDDGEKYSRIRSFDELVGYASAFDGLLTQAMEQNKTLFMYCA